MTPRERFDRLRAKYLAARDRRAEVESALRVKYGPDFDPRWASAAERRRYESALVAQGRAGDAFYAHLREVSPRDWGCGVPAHWLYEELTWEDAVRPTSEPLSVRGRKAYEARAMRTAKMVCIHCGRTVGIHNLSGRIQRHNAPSGDTCPPVNIDPLPASPASELNAELVDDPQN